MTHLKAMLRKKLRAERSAISSVERHAAALAAADLWASSDLFARHQHFACYLAHEHEFDASPIIKSIWQAQKHCYLPVLSGNELCFVAYREQDVLQPNRYGILEPVISVDGAVPVEQLEVVLVPLLGFDLLGGRLGTGGGYYDKTFEFLLARSAQKPYLIGLGYEQQQMDKLPRDAWDVPLSGIVTEKKIKLF